MKNRIKIFTIFLVQCILYKRIQSMVAGVDFGGEYFKIALVKPGSPFEIVTNIHSKRKTESMVAFDGEERLYGADAATIGVRKPEQAFTQIRRLLGSSTSHPQVESLIQQEYFPNELLHNVTRGSIGIKYGNERVYHAEELAAMVFSHARDITNAFADAEVKDWVLTVPSFFIESQKQALLDAADLANIRVLSLIDENTAAALQLGLDFIKEEPYYVLFYNLGSTSLQVSIVEYGNMTVPDGFRKNKTVGSFNVIVKTWDETLGGSKFDIRLAEHFANEFNKKYSKQINNIDVKTIPKVVSKIRAAATKTKIVLSANEEIPVVSQSLYNDLDLMTHMTRTKFEELCDDLFQRALEPVKKALEISKLSKSQINDIEIIGGGVRMPKIQKLLKEYFDDKDLSVHLNGDEAMALGAAFHGANISNSFRVRNVGMNDINPFAIGVRLVDLVPSLDREKPWVKRTSMFSLNERLDIKKSVIFTHDKDISCTFRYDQPSTLPPGSSAFISRYNITGIEEFAFKMSNDKIEGIPKITLVFHLDSSGISKISKAEATLEQEIIIEEDLKTVKKDDVKDKQDDKKQDKTTTNTNKGEETNQIVKKKKKKIHRKTLKVTRSDHHHESGISIIPMSIQIKKDSIHLLKKMDEYDNIRKENAKAKNALETFVYSTRDKISSLDDVISKVTTPEQVDPIMTELTEIEDWLYGEGDDLTANEYKKRHNDVKKKVDDILFRVTELEKRPESINNAKKYISSVRDEVQQWFTTKPQITESERNNILDKVTEFQEWLESNIIKQDSIPFHETPIITSNAINDKINQIKILVKILNKKPLPPPEKPKVNDTATSTNSTNTTNQTNNNQNGNESENELKDKNVNIRDDSLDGSLSDNDNNEEESKESPELTDDHPPKEDL